MKKVESVVLNLTMFTLKALKNVILLGFILVYRGIKYLCSKYIKIEF